MAGIAISQIMDNYLVGLDGSPDNRTEKAVEETASKKGGKNKALFDEAGKTPKTPNPLQAEVCSCLFFRSYIKYYC